MLLDLHRNHLVFSGIPNIADFTTTLQMHQVKFEKDQYHKFKIPLSHLNAARQALEKYKPTLQFTEGYLQFAKRFITCKDPITIVWNPYECEMRGEAVPFGPIIKETSYFDKKARQTQQFKKGHWDGMIHLFNAKTGRFPSGLLERIIYILQQLRIPYTVHRNFEYPAPYLSLSPSFSFEPTKDQIDAVEALNRANYGIAKLPTGFGKTSFVASALIAKKGVRSLFLANQRILIHDAKKDFEEVFEGNDVTIGIIGDSEFQPGDITVASIQGIAAALKPVTTSELEELKNRASILQVEVERAPEEERGKYKGLLKKAQNRLQKALNRKERIDDVKAYLKSVDLFIVDESQVLGTAQWNQFLRACPAAHRYTLSATVTRTDGGRLEIIAATGEVRYESSAAEQIEKKRLAEFRAYFKKFDHGIPKDMVRSIQMDFHQAYELFIVQNEARNRHLVAKTMEWAEQGFYVLALVTRRAHGEIVQKMLEEYGYTSAEVQGEELIPGEFAFVDGKTSKKKREMLIDAFRDGKIRILIGTSIFDVGFNAKNASKMVRFNGGGSEVREPQRAGRTVRMRDDESIGETYDIIDCSVPYFQFQSQRRVEILRKEFGYERIKILPGMVQGELDVARLEELAQSIPKETDQNALGQLIADLGFLDAPEADVPEETLSFLNELELSGLLNEFSHR